jgi:hypothetical protein
VAPARRLLAGVCAGLALLGALPAFAQSDRPRKRPQPPPVTAPADMGNTTGDAAVSPALRPGAPAPVLRSAVHSGWSRPATIAHSATAGQCRAQCSVQRTSCATGAVGAGLDASTCDPDWTRCLSACNGLTYSRGP